MTRTPNAVWLTTPHHILVEIAKDLGYRRFVLDIEHGVFDLDQTDRLIAMIRAMEVACFAKVLGPNDIAIQQMLDMGCDGVIIPHIGDVENARCVTASAKYPPLGRRSFAGSRTSRYRNAEDAWYAAENERSQCFPMIETAEALADIDDILALETVDGVFLGPTDLSLSRGRGAYRNTAEDHADVITVATAAKAAGKHWIMPAWSSAERALAEQYGAAFSVTADEVGVLAAGLEAAR